ncbi:MAG: hypothetical protein R3C24_11700 [Cyanobacteriota/Melainabacteria group bacterium]
MEKSPSTVSKAALDAIDHLALEVDDIVVPWHRYQERFGAKFFIKTPPGRCWSSQSQTGFCCKERKSIPPHLGIVRDDAEKYGKLKQHRDGSRSCYLKGPGGNVVEVLTPYSLDGSE